MNRQIQLGLLKLTRVDGEQLEQIQDHLQIIADRALADSVCLELPDHLGGGTLRTMPARELLAFREMTTRDQWLPG